MPKKEKTPHPVTLAGRQGTAARVHPEGYINSLSGYRSPVIMRHAAKHPDTPGGDAA